MIKQSLTAGLLSLCLLCGCAAGGDASPPLTSGPSEPPPLPVPMETPEPAGEADAEQMWNVLGDPAMEQEVLSDKPGSDKVRFFTRNPDGSEETVLELDGSAEVHDLDDDGINEILVYLPGEMRNLGIYDRVNGEIVYLDVNEALGSDAAGYMGNVGNLQNPEYRNGINAGFGEAGRFDRDEVYLYQDNTLTYACTFSEAMGW